MSSNGRSKELEAPFAMMGTAFVVLPPGGVIEMLEKNAITQTKGNLTLGILFRKIADDFRDWSKHAEPGCVFHAPEVNLHIVRLSAFAPLCMSLSVEAQKRAESAEGAPPSDRPLIFRE